MLAIFNIFLTFIYLFSVICKKFVDANENCVIIYLNRATMPNQPKRKHKMKYAFYTATSKTKFVMISKTLPGQVNDPEAFNVPVSGKREANKVAKLHNAKPWNF